MSGIAIGSPSLDHFDIDNIEPPPLDQDGCQTTQNEIPHSPGNNNNNNIPTISEQQQTTSESAIIMHRIASYLSINDAENMSLSRTSGVYSRQSTQFPHTRSRSVNSTQHSLDYVQYTTNNRNSKVSPLGNSSTYRSRSNSMNNQHQHLRANSSTTLNGDTRSNVDSSLDCEEDWFVGGQHSINSLNMGGGSRGHGGLTPHPRVVTLMPLEELGEECQGEGIIRDNNNPATAALEQQQQLLEGNSPEEELSLWTPAGQNTSESEDGLNNNASSREMLLPPGTVISSVHSEITTHVNDDSPTPPLQQRQTPKQPGFFTQRKQQRLQKQALQNKLAAAVFSHPHPLRDYCLDAYSTALSLSMSRQKKYEESCNNAIEGSSSSKVLFQNNTQQQIELRGRIHLSHQDILHFIFKHLLSNIPLSVLLDFIENTCNLSIETIIASSKLGSITISKSISILCDVSFIIIDILCKIPNPFHVFEFVVGVQKSAIGKTSDVLVTGIQSVATGVGSVSNAALNRLSRSGLALVGDRVVNASDRGSRSGVYVGKDVNVNENVLESKLFHRLQKMESVSKLVAYSERRGEEAFSRHAKKRAQRMMHYNVSFRPFTATIQSKDVGSSPPKRRMKHNVSFEVDREGGEFNQQQQDDDNDSVSLESINSSGSIFMRTPTSFPPTPRSRLYYFERGSQFTENVVFLARDQLRIERGVVNQNEQTRAMSKALIDGSRLAVFDASDVGNGIALTCGQHIATKVGNSLYCSCRSMIPVMRNSYVYFEISVSPSSSTTSSALPVPQIDATTLLVGLSTLEMPLDTLVGAWNGSVGLCSTGQILQSGQWFSLNNQEDCSYGANATVGCLVYLDDTSTYDDNAEGGPHVSMDVTFNINGKILPSSSASLFSGAGATTSISNQVVEGTDSPSRSAAVGNGDGCEPSLSLIVPKTHELFPTVTLHSTGTSVMCRFSAEDLLANSRSEIGVSSGVVVYAVDGSVIFDANEEDETFLDTSSQDDFFHGNV